MPTTPTPEFNALLAQAEAGDAEAQYQVGYAYRRGNPHYGVLINLEQAFKWFALATAQGHGNAQYNFGAMYKHGEFVIKNEQVGLQRITTAVAWIQEKARTGDAAAQCNIGFCYYFGDGVEKNVTQAFTWFEQSAQQGYAQAEHALGWCYKYGEGAEKDLKQAFNWCLKAAERGYAQAQSSLGICYKHGEGVEKNVTQAFNWYLKAAEQGLDQAQYAVGLCYKNGEGVEQSLQQAFAWYLKAAEQGYASAEYAVGICYKNGEGVQENLQKAIDWFKKASEQGEVKALAILGDYLKEVEQGSNTTSYTDTDDTIQNAFKELIDAQQKQFQKDMQKHNIAFEMRINEQLAEFQNQKSSIVENAKKELEKQGWFFAFIFLVIAFAFLGIMFNYLTGSLAGLTDKLQTQFEAQQKVVEMQLKLFEEKSNNQLPSKQ